MSLSRWIVLVEVWRVSGRVRGSGRICHGYGRRCFVRDHVVETRSKTNRPSSCVKFDRSSYYTFMKFRSLFKWRRIIGVFQPQHYRFLCLSEIIGSITRKSLR